MRSGMTSGRAVGTVVVVLALMGTLFALISPGKWFEGNRDTALARAGWQDDGKGTWKTEYGPLTALDRDFIRKVRSAGLWELPAGRTGQERGTTKSVRVAGDHLVDGHTELDKRAVEASRAMKVDLPTQPTGPQKEYLNDMEKAKGRDFDKTFVRHLRKQHGVVFGLVGMVRDATKNSMVRSLATRANAIVLDHMTVLEDTGLVSFEELNDIE
jgi:predicted outer membrane protein